MRSIYLLSIIEVLYTHGLSKSWCSTLNLSQYHKIKIGLKTGDCYTCSKSETDTKRFDPHTARPQLYYSRPYMKDLHHLKMKTFFCGNSFVNEMIEHTFIILRGIGKTTEKRLWQKGIFTWEDFISTRKIKRISSKRKGTYNEKLMEAQENLKNENSTYFSHCLHSREHWRLYETWKDTACFLDIETKGLSHGITVVGIYSTDGYKCYIRGMNLERELLQQELSKYNMLVTFYGRAFDMPFIERELDITLDVPHIDLCFTGKKLGLKGGLKKVEKEIGIEREEDIKGLNGFDAVRLWKEYKKGDENALDLLIKYNMADTVNLKVLADMIYSKLKEKTFLWLKTTL